LGVQWRREVEEISQVTGRVYCNSHQIGWDRQRARRQEMATNYGGPAFREILE